MLVYLFERKNKQIFLYKTDKVLRSKQIRSLHKYCPKSDLTVQLSIANLYIPAPFYPRIRCTFYTYSQT